MSLVLKLAAAALCAWALIALAAYLGQRRLMYIPDRHRTPPSAVGLATVEERTLRTPDGAIVVAWYGRARPGKPTLLYFHGNAGGLAARAERIRRFMGEGWGVYMMSYRGYSGGTGSPSETANVADARLAYGALLLEGVEPASVILYGESLGTGVAVRIATERKVAGVILDAPFTSMVDLAAQIYPFLPVRLFLADRYETRNYIGQVHVPVLVLHGERDQVVPVVMGRELFGLANEPKRLAVFRDGGHSDLYLEGNGALEVVRSWIGELERASQH